MRIGQRIRKITFPVRQRMWKMMRASVWKGGPPSGFFSEKIDLLESRVSGKIVSNGQRLPTVPHTSEIHAAGLDQDRHTNWTVLWTQRNNTFLAAPSLAHVNSSGQVCLEAAYGPHAWADPIWRRNHALPVRKLTGDNTSIISRWNGGGNFYHWFLDGLTRLIHLPNFPTDCKILIPANPSEFAIRSLEMLGLTHRVEETEREDFKVERYWFAGPSMLSGCPDPIGVEWLRGHFLKGMQPTARRFLYLERNAPTRRLSNAREVRTVFEEHGWETLDPGELSLDEQIRMFREARAVAGTHGAAMTNLLWTNPGTQVLELMPSRRRNGCYAGIALVAGLSHQSLVCPSSRKGDMRVSISSLCRTLDTLHKNL